MDVSAKLAAMDANGIAMTALSINDPGPEWFGADGPAVADEFPRLKLVCPHLGGTLPYLVGRLDHQTQVLKRGPAHLTRSPSEYLKSIWLDVVSPLPLAIKFAHAFMGADRLLFSSDHPWVEPGVIVECVKGAELSEGDQQKIFSANARTLFRL